MKRLIILTIVVGLLATAAIGAWTYYDLHKPIAHAKTGQYRDSKRNIPELDRQKTSG